MLGARVVARSERGEATPAGLRPTGAAVPARLRGFRRDVDAHTAPVSAAQPDRGAGGVARTQGILRFELSFTGTAADHDGEQYLLRPMPVFAFRAPNGWRRSTAREPATPWCSEVPLPLDEQSSDRWRDVASNLRSAEEEYGNGNYRGCIASCRIVMDAVGGLRDLKWAPGAEPLGGRPQKRHDQASARGSRVRRLAPLRHTWPTMRRPTVAKPAIRAPRPNSC